MRHRGSEVQRQASILNYWRAVEYFSPQPLEGPRGKSSGVLKVRSGTPLPWEQPEPIDSKFVWRYTVYAGIFQIAKIREVFQNVLPATESDLDHEGVNRGESALLSLTVDDTGRLYKDSVTLSSCGWALGRCVVPPGPGSDSWLDGFDDQQTRILQVLFGIGDGRIPVDAAGTVESGSKRALRLIAGVSARVALDVASGGLTAVPGLVGKVVGDHFGSIASTVAEKMAGAVTDDANKAILRRRDNRRSAESDTDAGGSPAADGCAASDQLGTKTLALEDLVAITRWVSEELGVDEVLEPTEIWIKPFKVSAKRADEVSGDELINSFCAADLERVAAEILDGNAGSALTSYLRAEDSIDPTQRVDLRLRPEVMLESVSPESMPMGRWPSPPSHALTLSQQFAINQIFAELKDPDARGLYAVNGPPGTGKTTMLGDLIAAIVVERAQFLATLENPRAAFRAGDSAFKWSGDDGYTRGITPLVRELTGFEMVVASSNNGAVENISLEIPSVDAIDTLTFPDADYFPGPATLAAGEPCWGSIAARLGKRANRSDFVQRFWWGEQNGRSSEDAELLGLQDILHALKNRTTNPGTESGSWSEAVGCFTAARAEVQRLTRERQAVADIMKRIDRPDATLAALRCQVDDRRELVARLRAHLTYLADKHADARRAVRSAQAAVDAARTAVDIAESAVRSADEHHARVQTALYMHAGTRPGWFKRICSPNSLARWEDDARPFADAVTLAEVSLEQAGRQRDLRAAQWREKQYDLTNASQTEATYRQRIALGEADLARAVVAASDATCSAQEREAELRRDADQLAAARSRWPHTIPGPEWQADPADRQAMEQRETSSPWMDEEFAIARSRLFLAALGLHRAVLTGEGQDPQLVWRNMRAACDVVKGNAPADLDKNAVLAAWQMLFFVVPVVSTTFASLPTMFSALGREDLGWLFIDEAGQATPQAAIGALWRCQRAVVVGDPRQIEPVVTLPWPGQRRLAQRFDVDIRWAPGRTSAQAVTDRVSRFGTSLPDPGELGQIWVGSPLRVHRRCDRLMFEVSNAIAYDNMMVYGVSGRADFPLGERNLWIHVDAPTSGEKWNPAEGVQVLKILQKVCQRIESVMENELTAAGPDLPEWARSPRAQRAERNRRLKDAVFIVSPFRQVATELAKYLDSHNIPLSRTRLGTVHTTQGKEADIVILVLGTATDQKRARDWAASAPNLLNVAITRAKRRLVIVGDYDNWSPLRHFHTLAQHTRPGGMLERWPRPDADHE